MAGKQKKTADEDPFGLILGDFGIAAKDFKLPDITLDMFEQEDESEEPPLAESRYIKPRIYKRKRNFVTHKAAKDMVMEIGKITDGQRVDAFVNGSFIFADFIAEYLTANNLRTEEMTISTLSISEYNVDYLRHLMDNGTIGRLNIVISVYFWGNERRKLIPYILQKLDVDDRFQLAIGSIHTKTCHFVTNEGQHIVMHGSANLRSSGSIEEFSIEDDEELFNFYDEVMGNIIAKYATIRKPLTNSAMWDAATIKQFND